MDSITNGREPLKPSFLIPLCGLLLLFWGFLLWGNRSLSFSMDEPLHIAAGYAFLAKGTRSLWHLSYYLQPPIPGVLEAFLFYLSTPAIPVEKLAGWNEDYVVFTASFMPYLYPFPRTEIICRLPVMLAGVLVLAVAFRWAASLSRSSWMGMLVMLILALDPLLRAHSRLATTDTLATLMALLTGYMTWRWLCAPSWRMAISFGLCLGIALITKFSAVLYLLSSILLVGYRLVRMRGGSSTYRLLIQVTVSLVIALLIVWAVFGGEIGYIPEVAFPLPVPAPRYWRTLLDVDRSAHWRSILIFGELQFGSHWWYFPLNFLIKNPLPWLIAVIWGAVALMRTSVCWDALIAVTLLPLVYSTSAILRGMNVSYRHMLPVHPFLAMLAAYGIWRTLKKRPVWRPLALWIPLGLWYAGGTLAIFPDELAYFNELVGGPAGAPRYLVDYTQDWGQSMKQLRAYLNAHPGPEPYIVYYTSVRPEYYGIRYQSLAPSPGAVYEVTPLYPQPGRYAIGVATLYGLVGRDRMELEWFRRATPQAMVGHAYYVYDVQEGPHWLFQCPPSSPPLDDQAVLWGLGPGELRRGTFDCAEGWIYPAGGRTLGVYTVHGHLLVQSGSFLPPSLRPPPVPVDPFVQRHLAGARLAYYQPFFGWLPAFALYEQGPVSPQGHYQMATAVKTAGGESFQAPVALAGPLTFLGVMAFREESGLEVETWWQVTEGPITRPLSVMGHLLNGAGEAIGQNDGLGVSPVLWQPGDVIVQRHRFPLPPEGEELWLRTGVYWLDTMERWSLKDSPKEDILWIPLLIRR